MANFLVMSTLDNAFTIGKVAFGESDYAELSGYFTLIFAISLAIYFQLFRATQRSVEEEVQVQSSPEKAVKVDFTSPVKVAAVTVTVALSSPTKTKSAIVVEGEQKNIIIHIIVIVEILSCVYCALHSKCKHHSLLRST